MPRLTQPLAWALTLKVQPLPASVRPPPHQSSFTRSLEREGGYWRAAVRARLAPLPVEYKRSEREAVEEQEQEEEKEIKRGYSGFNFRSFKGVVFSRT